MSKNIDEETIKKLNEKSIEVELSFNIYVYDSIEELANGLRKRGFKDSPDSMCACHKDEDNSLNFLSQRIIQVMRNGRKVNMKV